MGLLQLLHHHSDLIDTTLNDNQIDPYTPTRKRRNSNHSTTHPVPSQTPSHPSSSAHPISHPSFHCPATETITSPTSYLPTFQHPPTLNQHSSFHHPPTIYHPIIFHHSKDPDRNSSPPKAEGRIEVMLLCAYDALDDSPWKLNQVSSLPPFEHINSQFSHFQQPSNPHSSFIQPTFINHSLTIH